MNRILGGAVTLGLVLEEAATCHLIPEGDDSDCAACAGDACLWCGAGAWTGTPRCDHDFTTRHYRGPVIGEAAAAAAREAVAEGVVR